jgi:hypothetical protein
MTGRRQRMRERREQLEAMLATASGWARSRSMVVDTMVGVAQRERPVAVGILAGSLAFRLFALMIPSTYVLVAGLGFAAQASAGLEMVVLAVLWLALSMAMPRPPGVPWTAPVPGAGLFAVGFLAFARLAVAAAELNATLWEGRRPAG